MRTPAFLLPGLLLLAAALPAAASPFTPHFNDLLVELNARDAALPASGLTAQQRKEKAALGRAFTALAADSKDLAGDLRMAQRMAKALEAGYPGDAAIAGLLAGLVDRLAVDVRSGRDELDLAIEIAAGGKFRDRAAAKLSATDAALAAADAEPASSRRAALLRKAHGLSLKGSRLAAKAGPGGSNGSSSMSATVDGAAWAANADFGTAVGGLATVSDATGGLRALRLAGRRILPSAANPNLPGDSSLLQITLTSVGPDIAAGTYPIGTTGGVNAAASWILEGEDGSYSQCIGVSGSVTLSALQVNAGSVDAAGSFAFTLYDGVLDATCEVTGGLFEAAGVPRTGAP